MRLCGISALLFLMMGVGLVGAAPSAAWAPKRCDVDPPGPEYDTSTRCIGHREIRARGRIREGCIRKYYASGVIYPERNWCGGGGPEYIAQARGFPSEQAGTFLDG